MRGKQHNGHRYFAFYKPFGMLSQFTRDHPGQATLADAGIFPSGVYPVGRLDKDSEGLLLLTSDPAINARLLDPAKGHIRTYLVQVEGEVTEDAIRMLEQPMNLRIKKKPFRTQPAKVEMLFEPPDLPERFPPIRFRKHIPTSWISISLKEGKNHQVRKMCAAAGFPVLRLVRTSIEHLEIGDLQPGQAVEYTISEFRKLLRLRAD